MDKFQGKYRIAPARAQWWNYGWDAAYFITICTKDRETYFGRIIDGEMILSDAGKIADQCWREIPNHASNIELGEYVVMPNHVHGILVLNADIDPGTHVATIRRDKACLVSARSRPPRQTIGKSRFQNPGRNTISSIIGAYKSAVSKSLKRLRLYFEWQSRFHDHIIRNEENINGSRNILLVTRRIGRRINSIVPEMF